MKIGVPKEVKIHEYRVGLVPAGVRELVDSGHAVLVQSGAGAGIGFEDSHYLAAGGTISKRAEDIFGAADLIVKVKEPQLNECKMLRSNQTLFTYLHLAADREQTQALMASGATAIAYETVPRADGSLPLLTPMSEVAGRMSVQVGAQLPAEGQRRVRRAAGRRARALRRPRSSSWAAASSARTPRNGRRAWAPT